MGKKRQQRIKDGDVAETKSSEESTTTVIQYDDDLEVAMEKQQSKIETKTEQDFTAIKSAATNKGPQMDTDLEEAMRKRQMRNEQIKEGEFKDVTGSASSETKNDNDFEAAMLK